MFHAVFLHKRWVHRPEEDTPDTMVFRSADTPLPASRGRWGFELRDDGRAEIMSAGRSDVPDTIGASWQLSGAEGDQLELQLDTGETHRWQIVDIEGNRLELRTSAWRAGL